MPFTLFRQLVKGLILSLGLALLNGVGGLLPLFGAAAIVQPFDMISMLGFLILMGTVVNNPILVVHRAVESFNSGSAPLEAVREAVHTRLRPIAMSTITTLCGLAPLVLIPGAGTELYRVIKILEITTIPDLHRFLVLAVGPDTNALRVEALLTEG